MNQTLHQKLLQLRDRAQAWLDTGRREHFHPLLGICENLELKLPGRNLLRDLLDQWPESTGCKPYPVPHPVKGPGSAYIHTGEQEMWNPQYEYARNRWALLEWLIEQTASEADQ